MRGHNICFHLEIRKIIFELSLIPLLIWSSALHLYISVPFCLVWIVVNTVAWGYGTTQALPFMTVILLMSLWLFGKYMYLKVQGNTSRGNNSYLTAICFLQE